MAQKEKLWTKTSAFRTWKSKVKQYSLKKREREPIDMCKGTNFCSGAKNIPRKLMPQIYDVKEFAKKIREKFGVDSRRKTMRARNLKPSQNQINRGIVHDVIHSIETRRMKKNPLVVSKDCYVIDGHHRWAAYKKMDPSMRIPVLMIDAPVNDALGIAIAASGKREAF